MATAIQVTLYRLLKVGMVVLLFPFIEAIEVHIEILSNVPEGFYITKLSCSGRDVQVNVPESEIQLFSVTGLGEMVLKHSLNSYENQLLTVQVTRFTSRTECPRKTNIPQISRMFISVKPPSHFISFPMEKNEIRGFVDLTGSSQVQGRDIEQLLGGFGELSPVYTLLGNTDAANLFKIRKDDNGNQQLHLSNFEVLPYRVYHLICKVDSPDGRVLFTNVRVDILNSHKIMSDIVGTRRSSVHINGQHDIRTPTGDLTVTFDQDKTMTARRTRLQHRHKRQVKAAAVTTNVDEGTTGSLYVFTRQGTGTTFTLKEAVPDMVTVNTNGQVFLKSGHVLDYDNGAKSILVEVYETTGNEATASFEHTLTINVVDINDEIPKITNNPKPMLARVDPWAAVGTTVYTVTGLDQDQGSVLGFYMAGSSDKFEIEELTGKIKTKAGLSQNYDEEVTVYLRDNSANPIQNSVEEKVAITTRYRAPQFYLTEYFSDVPENAQLEQTFNLKDSNSLDIDLQTVNFQKGTITYSIINPRTQGPSTIFGIKEGRVLTLTTYDHEKVPQYKLQLKAKDSESELFSLVDLTVRITDINEFNPVFNLSPDFAEVPETKAIGDTVMQVTATDKDTSSSLTYSVDNEFFDVITLNNVGNIQVKKQLDYETTRMHTFTVFAVDDGGVLKTKRTSSATVIIKVQNVNDLAPVFVDSSITMKVLDDADDAGASQDQKLVLDMTAYDSDGDSISYRLGGGTHDVFTINQHTGIITLVPTTNVIPDDVNEYNFEVLAVDDNGCCSDKGVPLHTSTASVTVYIIDAVNKKPQFNCNYKPKVMEEQPVGTPVVTVEAIDESRGATSEIEYSLRLDRNFDASLFFKIDKKTGNITTTKVLDREQFLDTMFITVQATDRGDPPLSDLCTFRVELEDKNDHKPIFTSSSYSQTLYTGSGVGTVAIVVLAEDLDTGVNADITYTLTQNIGGYFDIQDSSRGIIRIARTLDMSVSPIELVVMARDGGTPQMSSTATITMTLQSNYPPPSTPQPLYTFSMSEVYDIGTVIGNISVSSNVDQSAVSLQIVNRVDGLLTIRESDATSTGSSEVFEIVIAKERIRYETHPVISLVLRASNEQQEPQNTYIFVQINNQDANMLKPEVIGEPFESADNYNIKLDVLEGLQPPEVVGFVVAVDDDRFTPAFSNVTYYEQAVSDYFSIDSTTGEIKTKQTFDAEQQQIYYFSILMKDGAPSAVPNHRPPGSPNSATATVQIQISDANDNVPSFEQQQYAFSVREDEPILSSVGEVRATDKDSGHVFRFTMNCGVSVGSIIPLSINWTSGAIYVSGKLDYETRNNYACKAKVFDGKFTAETDVTITVLDVNDMPPVFSESLYSFSGVTEGDYTNNPFPVGTVSATDGDTGRTTQTNIQYSIFNQPGDLSVVSVFEINSTSGQIMVKGELDRDTQAVIKFLVKAVDEPSSPQALESYAIVEVHPGDVNDNAPIFDQGTLLGSVMEEVQPGTSVMTVIAEDNDQGANGEVSYSLVPGNVTTFVLPDRQVGQINTFANIDRETNDMFLVAVTALDGATGAAAKSTTGTATIYVIDINDHEPKCDHSLQSVSLPETKSGNIILVGASDQDASAILSYSVTAADFTYFAINQEDGLPYLYVHTSPDYDAGVTFLNVSVTVSDGQFSDVCYVQVTVEDVNDNAPTFSDINVLKDGNFSEDIAENTVIANFTATDIDSGDNKLFEFFILLESDPNKYFAVRNLPNGHGEVITNRPLDRETVPTFDLVVLAIDSGSPPQTGSTTINIVLGDVNDNAPRLIVTEVSIKENLPPQSNFVTLYAEDPDSEENGPPFSFDRVLCDSNFPTVCNKFEFDMRAVDASLGGMALSVSSLVALDREDISQYHVNVVIRDKAGLSATSTLTIKIDDENDNINTDAVQAIFVYNYKGLFKNVIIGRTGFKDPDGPNDVATKTFTKISDYTDAFVRVEPNGDIEMLSNLPYEAFDFKVRVVDTGVKGRPTPVTSTTTVTLTQQDLDEEAPYRAGSVLLSGITAKEFISTPTDGESSYDKTRKLLADKLGKPEENVQIVTILDKDDLLEVRFAAHGSPYYSSARLNGIVTANKNEFETATGGKVEMVGVSACLKESCEGGCWDKLVVEDAPNVINAGTETKVGVMSGVTAQCGCRVPVSQMECTPDYCFNDGQCVKDDYGLLKCVCTAAFDGPRCQNTKKGFSGTGYALFKPLEQCLQWETSIEFITVNANGIIFYNGPLTALSYTDPTDYIFLQLRNGHPELRVDLGTGVLSLYLNRTGASTLSDGKWHRIDIIKDGKMFTLVVDGCRTASAGDRSSCEMSGYTKSTHMYLNVNTPLQMGGLSSSTVTTPSEVIETKFTGCMRNLRHKGELYDLHTGGVYPGTTDSCPDEDQACGNKCGDNGECRVNDITTTPKTTECICDNGYRGSNCETATTVVDFRANSFMEWSLVNSFAQNLSPTVTNLKLMYRSRDQEGVLFHLSSSDAAKFIRLQIVNNELVLVYNLGGDQGSLAMSGVKASDGQWHSITITRLSKSIMMTMDGGEGPRYVTTHGPANSLGEITLLQRQIYAGAEVMYADSSATTGTFGSKDFNSSCYNDIRMEMSWFPMTTQESSNNQDVKLERRTSVQNNCERNDCQGVSCPTGFVCHGLWEAYTCRCPAGKEEVNSQCVDINYCRDSPCLGEATCVNGNGTFICHCPEGWEGKRCNQLKIIEVVPEAGINAGLIAGIIIAIVFVLIIAFLVVLLYRRCAGNDDMANLVEDEKEDYDIRENIVAYDEEGAGEEDHEGYDLNRLRKPMDMSRVDKPLMNMENERPVKSGPPQGPGIGEFIGDRLGDADDDPNAPPYDTVMELNYEGGGSSAGSLSSLNTSSSGGDQDYDYLNSWGPKFAKLADMYNQYEDSD